MTKKPEAVLFDEPITEETLPEIEDDIPMPEKNSLESKWRLHELNVGQSIAWPLEDRNAVSSRISTFHKKSAKRFRTGPDPRNKGNFRIWRMADDVNWVNSTASDSTQAQPDPNPSIPTALRPFQP